MPSLSFPHTALHPPRPTTALSPAAPIQPLASVDIVLAPILDVDALEPAWRDLAARADHSFFLSWPWVGTWLRHLPNGTEPHLLTARVSNRIVGLAVVCRRPALRLGLRRRSRFLLSR